MVQGFFAVLTAFVIWGFVPLFWRLLTDVPVLQVLAHRVVFCALIVVTWLSVRERLSWLAPLRAAPRLTLVLVVSSLLLAANGGLYVHGVTSGQVVATSLGYFINPLVNVLLGVVLLRERLTRSQWIAVGLATLGVAYLSYSAGALPWLSLALAGSFSAYGLIRKRVAFGALAGLAVECLLLLPLAFGYLVWVERAGVGAFGHAGLPTTALLAAAGAVTALPLAAFAYGARRLPYSTVGIVQYVAPSLQLACAVFAFKEPFARDQLLGFGLIWSGLVLYAFDVLTHRRDAPASV
ncbi:MAG: EamA family transporter RarD [Pseudomonadota bacterium]|jgi:chloramphenicol-sensitive protein RarD